MSGPPIVPGQDLNPVPLRLEESALLIELTMYVIAIYENRDPKFTNMRRMVGPQNERDLENSDIQLLTYILEYVGRNG